VKRSFATLLALAAFAAVRPADSRSIGESAASSVRAIPPDGGVVSFAPLRGFIGRLRVPSNDAKPGASVTLQSSYGEPDGAPPQLVQALATASGRSRVFVWLEATPSDDVEFDPGDVGFTLALRALTRNADVAYFALACERSDCKPRELGPLYSDGSVLEETNAHSPFHFHFAVRAGHDYFAVIFSRRCREGACE
jgi:hypothetical protein